VDGGATLSKMTVGKRAEATSNTLLAAIFV
jgi:hypothetical protein